MEKIQLKGKHKKEDFLRLYRKSRDVRLRERYQAMYLSFKYSWKEIAEILDRDYETILAWVKLYNEKKDPKAPVIKKGAGNYYNLVVNNARIKFTVLNYVNDQIFVNNRLVTRSRFGLKKTSWNNPFISDAVAEDDDQAGSSVGCEVLRHRRLVDGSYGQHFAQSVCHALPPVHR
mgnify:CR=1 FL=1